MLGKKNRKNVVKKTAAAALAVTVMCTAVPMCSLQKAEAVSKVSIVTSKKLKAGQSYKLKLKNAAGWTVQSAKTENKKIVKITKRAKTNVTVSALRAGWCNVTVRAKNSGSGKTKKLKCRIQVSAGVKREVSTQAQLNAALKKKDVEQITIHNTTQETSYQIPAGIYSNVALIVKAGSAKVTNNGTFRSVAIQDSKKGGSWTENAKGNSLRVTSTVSKIVVSKGAKVANLSLEKAGTDTQLEIKGKVSKVAVSGANTKLAISGSTASVVPITVKKAASGAEITASVRVNATVKAKKVQVTLNKGAEESTIQAIRVKTEVVNNADGNVTVTDGNGTTALAPGKEMTTVVSSGTVDNEAGSTEGKNEKEVKVLQSIIKKQNSKGASIPENLNDGRYTWENGHLKEMNLQGLGLTGELDVSSLTSLQELNCAGNQLTNLEVSGMTSLQRLYCDSNQLTNLDVSGMSSLQWLICASNQLAKLDVNGLDSLQWLTCSENLLVNLDVRDLPSLKTLYCSENSLSDFNMSGLAALEYLNCSGNQLTSLDVSGLAALDELVCYGNQLVGLNVEGLKSLKRLDCGKNLLTSLSVSGLALLESLDCSSNRLMDLNVDGLTALKSLSCYWNQIANLDVGKLPTLESLNCSVNRLTNLDVGSLAFLKSLDCSSNQLINLDVSGLTFLVWLDCSHNQLTGKLDVSRSTKLEKLDCENNQLTGLNVNGLTSLQRLDCEDNQLTELNVGGLKSLQYLSCYNNQLAVIDVSGLTSLEQFLGDDDLSVIGR